ncbi:hypothetical protein [Desulfonatronospira sp.]|uniref:hypothetical protein n=1 Tax=Desulfonatronospira sp. TaxID=1962951 RepID=UPI0025B8CC4D|nr:hypothetical protein [Desulfonatronospira sp.]
MSRIPCTPALPAKLCLAAALVFIMGLSQPDCAQAHRMLMQEKEPGVLFVYYEGRVPAAEAAVTLLDEQDEMLLQGKTDTEGHFYFDPRLGARVARADDGQGHRVVYDLEKSVLEEGFLFIGDDIPLALRVALGVGIIFILFGALYLWSTRGRRKKNAHS